ncbi:hypothetical protein [Nocardia salmonicida]|uniref:hypothetical protein n=1 Tax=Nocardia salmonicida TaxID=53431 RepID=UPI0007A49776|nr:hypothetical protein [Nocardia salmonicida]MBC7299440.1 hypothetical protein [Nocardia sp.]
MQLFERLNQRDIRVESTVPTTAPLTFRDFRRAARDSVRVAAHDCAAWMAGDLDQWASEADHNPLDLVGPLRPPFDSMWIEWSFPDWSATDGTCFAAWVTADEPHANAPAGAVQELTIVVLRAKKTVAQYTPVWTFISVDEHGRALSVANNVDPNSRLAGQARSWALPACAAIGFMNCRNIQVTEIAPGPRRARSSNSARGTAKKPNQLSHHVIQLPSTSQPRNLTQARESAGAAIPLHVVRGHFKTFTTEAPLLGKHVGTYWWHPTIRGLRDHGATETSYRVGPSLTG